MAEEYPNLMAEAVTEEEARLWSARTQLPHRKQGHKGWAIQGPFPWPQFCVVAKLPGQALAVWLLIHHRQRMSKQPWVTLSTELLLEAGIQRKAKDRALEVLERHGLIQVIRWKGRSARIALVPYQPDSEEEETTTQSSV